MLFTRFSPLENGVRSIRTPIPKLLTPSSDTWSLIVEAQHRTYCRRDRVREIAVGDEQVHATDRKGHRYIAVLLANPYKSISAIDLKAMDDGCDPRLFHGSSGPVTTYESLFELSKRCAFLTDDLGEAKSDGDVARQEMIATELSRLLEERVRGIDRRGRPRVNRNAEKVRLAVTVAVRRALWAIGQHAPLLKEYFRHTIDTGESLMFRPVRGESWNV
jgi:hypothetical protein